MLSVCPGQPRPVDRIKRNGRASHFRWTTDPDRIIHWAQIVGKKKSRGVIHFTQPPAKRAYLSPLGVGPELRQVELYGAGEIKAKWGPPLGEIAMTNDMFLIGLCHGNGRGIEGRNGLIGSHAAATASDHCAAASALKIRRVDREIRWR